MREGEEGRCFFLLLLLLRKGRGQTKQRLFLFRLTATESGAFLSPFSFLVCFIFFARSASRERTQAAVERKNAGSEGVFYSLCLWRGEEEKRGKNLQTNKNKCFFFREKRRFLSTPPSLSFSDYKKGEEKSAFPPFVNEQYFCCWWWCCFVDCELIVEVFLLKK